MVSCGSVSRTTAEKTQTISVKESNSIGIDTLSLQQMDYMMAADDIPELSKWSEISLRDYETNGACVYKILFDQTTGITYSVKVLKFGDADRYCVKKNKW